MAWHETELARTLGVHLPILQAPMAGGWTTPQLVAAVSEAGGLGALGAAVTPPDELREQIRAVRALTAKPFGVNLFAELPAPSLRGVQDWATAAGVPVPAVAGPAGPRLADQLAVVAQERVPVLSFTFGLVPLDGLDCVVLGTATTVAEARALQEHGVHAIVAQGSEAGGHRATFLGPVDAALIGTMALVPQVVDAVDVPVVAAGGIMDGRGIAAARALGAQGAQLGTAFLGTDEAAVPADYLAALHAPTTVTRSLTGRAARSVRTPYVDRMERSGLEPPDFPLPRLFLQERPFLAGQGGPLLRRLPAAELVRVLEREVTVALDAAAARGTVLA